MHKKTVFFIIVIFFAVGITGGFWWFAQHKKEQSMPLTTLPKEHSVVKFETPAEEKKKSMTQDEIFYMAKNAFENGNFSEALQNINFYLEKNPESIEGLELVRDISIARLNFSESLLASEKLLALQPQNIEFSLKHAEIFMLQNELGKAKEALQKIPATHAKRIFFEGIIFMAEGNEETGKERFSALLNNPEYSEIAQKFLHVFDEFQLFKDGNPNYKKAMIGAIFNALQFHQITIGYLLPVLRELPEYRDPWILVGHSYFSLKQFYPQALNALEKAVSLDPSHPKSVYFLALNLTELERFDDAQVQFQNALNNGFSPPSEIYRQRADLFLRKQDFAKADEAFAQFLQEDKNITVESYAKPVHNALFELKNPDRGLTLATECATKFSQEPLAFTLLGAALLEKNEYEKSKKAFEKALSMKEDFPAAHYYQGKLMEKQEKWEEALEEYKKAYAADKGGIYGSLAAKAHNALLGTLQNS